MKFDGKLLETLGELGGIVSSDMVHLRASEGKLRIHVLDYDKILHGYVSRTISGEGDDSWETSCALNVLQPALRGRKEVEIEFDKMLKIKSGKYKAEITTQGYTKPPVSKPKDGQALTMAIMENLLNCLDKVSVKDVLVDKNTILLHYAASSKGIMAASGDGNHAILYRNKKLKSDSDISFSIPSEYSSAIGAIKGKDVKLAVSEDNMVHVWSNTMHLALPLLQGGASFEQLSTMLSPFLEAEGKVSIFNPKKANGVLGNLSALYEQTTGIDFDFQKGKLIISASSAYGSAKDSIPLEGNCFGEIRIDHVPASELLGKMNGDQDVKFTFISKKDVVGAVFIEDIFSSGKEGKKIETYVYSVRGLAKS